jgi:hypothetical protein
LSLFPSYLTVSHFILFNASVFLIFFFLQNSDAPHYKHSFVMDLQVTSDVAMAMARRLAKEEGLLVGISAGAAVQAAIEVIGGAVKGCVPACRFFSNDFSIFIIYKQPCTYTFCFAFVSRWA